MNRPTQETEGPTSSPPKGDDLAVRAVTSTAWSMSGQVVQVVLGLGAFAILSRWLTPYDYGLFGMAATVTGIVGIIGDAGVGLAIARRQQIDASDEATGFWLSLGGGAFLTAISAVSAPILARFYRSPGLLGLALAMSTTFLLSAPARVSLAKLSRHLRFKISTLANLIGYAVATVLAIMCASRGLGAWSLYVQMAVNIVLVAVLTIPFAPPRIRPSLVTRGKAREISKFGWQVSGYSTTIYLGRSLEGVFAGRYLGSAAVGLLTMGTRLIFFSAERLCASTSAVFVPTAVEIGDVSRQARAFHSATRLLYMLVAPFCVGSIAIASELVAWLPPKWAALAPVLRAYAFGTLFAPMNHLTYSILAVHGKAAQLLRVALILLPIAWGGAALGAFSGSVVVLVLVWGGCLALGALMQLGLVWRILGMDRRYWSQILLPLAISAVMAVLVHSSLGAAGLAGRRTGLIVGALIGAAFYIGFAWLLMRPDITRIAGLMMKALPGRRRA